MFRARQEETWAFQANEPSQVEEEVVVGLWGSRKLGPARVKRAP